MTESSQRPLVCLHISAILYGVVGILLIGLSQLQTFAMRFRWVSSWGSSFFPSCSLSALSLSPMASGAGSSGLGSRGCAFLERTSRHSSCRSESWVCGASSPPARERRLGSARRGRMPALNPPALSRPICSEFPSDMNAALEEHHEVRAARPSWAEQLSNSCYSIDSFRVLSVPSVVESLKKKREPSGTPFPSRPPSSIIVFFRICTAAIRRSTHRDWKTSPALGRREAHMSSEPVVQQAGRFRSTISLLVVMSMTVSASVRAQEPQPPLRSESPDEAKAVSAEARAV